MVEQGEGDQDELEREVNAGTDALWLGQYASDDDDTCTAAPSEEEVEETGGPIRKSDRLIRLTLNVVTRWNSTWYMLHRFLLLKGPVSDLLREGIRTPDQVINPLTSAQWKMLLELYSVLEPFKDLTKRYESEKSVTCSVVLQGLCLVRNKVKAMQFMNQVVKEFRDTLINKMDYEFDDPYWFLGIGCMTMLDPSKATLDDELITKRFWGVEAGAFGRIREEYPNPEDWIRAVHDECKALIRAIRERSGADPIIVNLTEELENAETDWLDATPTVPSDQGMDEWPDFCAIRARPQRVKVLEWWASHQDQFPTISVLAGEYLCIPASSASIERMFSVNGHHLNKRRRGLEKGKVQELTMLRDNLDML